MSDSGDLRPIRHSIFERIAWTYDLNALDQRVLGCLATFGHWKTGTNNHPKLETLSARCHTSRAALSRSLQRMVTNGYLVARPFYKKPTDYDICLDRLAVDMKGTVLHSDSGTQEDGLRSDSGTQNDEPVENLHSDLGTQKGVCVPIPERSKGVLHSDSGILCVPNSGRDLVVRTDPQYVQITNKDDQPLEPALSAPSFPQPRKSTARPLSFGRPGRLERRRAAGI